MISLLKMWIPDHPEAGMAKTEFYKLWTDAVGGGWCEELTLVSMLSGGVEDIMIYDFDRTPVSVQTLLVQREGTEAFLDARNALRVVRRKFGMMTLISRMAGLFEQRNLHAITIRADISEAEHLSLARLIASRSEGTSAEEEQRFKSAWRRAKFESVKALYHSDVIGRRLPVGWQVKAFYTQLAQRIRKGQPAPDAAQALTEERAERLAAKDFGQLAQYADRLQVDLEAPGEFDPADGLIAAAPERPLLVVTRRLYDDFRLLRRERAHQRHEEDLSIDGSVASGSLEAHIDDDFADAAADEDDDELRRIAHALDRIRRVRGREFFNEMTAFGDQIDFAEALDDSDTAARRVDELNPLEAFAHARNVQAPYYQTRALAGVVPRLMEEEHEEQAGDAARLCLIAARDCEADDVVEAMVMAIAALLTARQAKDAGDAIAETIGVAHQQQPIERRAEALMRIASMLFESGALPPEVRERLSAAFLGEDVHFWGKAEVSPALVETCLGLLSSRDEDTLIFLRKVVAHPEVAVRRSVLRSMPLGDDTALRNVLLQHLKDPAPEVRREVIERIGASGDRGLFIYLVNHLRHGDPPSRDEARALAMNMCRLDPDRSLPFINAMLGKLAAPDKELLRLQAPIKHADDDMQLAALEALYRLNLRAARHVLFQLTKRKLKGDLIGSTIQRIWPLVKSKPYGEPELPRSPHHPEWTEAEDVDFLDALEAAEPEIAAAAEPDLPEQSVEEPAQSGEEPASRKGGLFGKIRTLLSRGRKDEGDEGAPDEAADAGEASAAIVAAPGQADGGPAPAVKVPARAALQFEGVLLEGPELWSGNVKMAFALYPEEDGKAPIWTETLDTVAVRRGTFNVMLGLDAHLPEIPKVAWLGMAVDGGQELQPRTRLGRARTIVQG